MHLPGCEKLLHLISVQGQLGITRFLDYFEQLYPGGYGINEEESYYIRLQTIRFLESLGHCEYDYETRRIYACKPVIVMQSKWGLPQAVLTGARSPALIDSLRKFVAVNKDKIALKEVSQPYYPVLPNALLLKATSYEILEQAALNLGISCDLEHESSSILLNFSSDFQEIYDELDFRETTEINWPKLVFSTGSLSFSRAVSSLRDSPVLTEYTNRITKQKVHFLWVDGRSAEIERDWGRLLTLFLENKNVFLYDKKKFQLLAPKSIPLPSLIARAVTLKSGLVPVEKVINRKRYWIYSGVDPIFAGQFARKIGQSLQEI